MMSLRGRSVGREKTFGLRAVPLDRNMKVRLKLYVVGYNARCRRARQHRGPITRAFMEVLEALLWGFHNSRTGRCFPSYEAIAAKARCCRATVHAAIRALEQAGILTWSNRITRKTTRVRDGLGRWIERSVILRTSNTYAFIPIPDDRWSSPCADLPGSKNHSGTRSQDISMSNGDGTASPQKCIEARSDRDTGVGLLAALHALGRAIAEKEGLLTQG